MPKPGGMPHRSADRKILKRLKGGSLKYIFISVIVFSTLSLRLILKAEEKPEIWGVGFHPVIGYDEDTNWIFGAASVFYFNPDPYNKNQELDELALTAAYNLRGGYEINTDILKNSRGNHSILEVSTGYQKIVSDDYGTVDSAFTAVYSAYDQLQEECCFC